MSTPSPTNVKLAEPGLLAIRWTNEELLHYPVERLRAGCPCAHCLDADPEDKHPIRFVGVSIASIKPVGNYALQIGFSDGHNIGIYTFERLLQLGYPEGTAPPSPKPESFSV